MSHGKKPGTIGLMLTMRTFVTAKLNLMYVGTIITYTCMDCKEKPRCLCSMCAWEKWEFPDDNKLDYVLMGTNVLVNACIESLKYNLWGICLEMLQIMGTWKKVLNLRENFCKSTALLININTILQNNRKLGSLKGDISSSIY